MPGVTKSIFLLGSLSLLSAQIIHPPSPTRPQTPAGSSGFNLDFETSFEGAPTLWNFVNATNNEYQEALDTSVYYSGSQSLRISSSTAPSTDKGYVYQDIPASLLRGREVRLSGAIRT